MMNIKKMEQIFEKGVDLNICALLYMFRGGEQVDTEDVKIGAFIQLMEKKGLILEGRISLQGEELLKSIDGEEEVVSQRSRSSSLEEIYDIVQQRILELTGTKQKKTVIFGKTYNYFPNKYDFVLRLKGVVNKYKLKDLEKVEKVIINNIEHCHKTNKWYPLFSYYLTKDNISQFASDYEAWEEGKKIKQEEYDGTNI